MQKTLICQPMFNGILWEIFKMPAQNSWAATERKIGMLHTCDQRLPDVILLFWIYLLICSQYIKTCELALFWAQILGAVAANTVGEQACSLYKIRTLGHSLGSDFLRFLIKLMIGKPQVSELEVSLLLFAERADSLLYSTWNNIHVCRTRNVSLMWLID